MLSGEFVRQWSERHVLVPLTIDDLDICDEAAVRLALRAHAPDVVINCAAYNAVDAAEESEDAAAEAFAVNAEGVGNIAAASSETGVPLVHFSTDYVFDGTAGHPYTEHDAVNPLGAYARSKAAGERAVREHAGRYIIARLSWLIGHDGPNFVETMLRLAAQGDPVRVVNDQTGSPTFCADVVPVIEKLVTLGHPGIYHMTGRSACTWYDFAQEIFRQAGFDPPVVAPVTTAEFARPAPRPASSYLRNLMLEEKLGADPMPDWREGLARYLASRTRAE